MITEQKHNSNNAIGLFAGILVGGLTGAITALLMAPQPGEKTRAQIKQKSFELRDRSVSTINDAKESLNSKTHQITSGVHAKAEELEHQGREAVIKQLDHVSEMVEAGKTAVKGSEKS
jgi:gas vesicle protein